MTNTFQLCPKCNGTGTSFNYNALNTSAICDVCKGAKIISMLTGLPPQQTTIQTQTNTTNNDKI